LSNKDVAHNAQCIRKQLEHFLDFEGDKAARMVNNADWLGKLTFIGLLRDIGKHFSVNVMLNKESVRQRLEDRDHGISFTEFTYSLLQAYDFLHLADTYGCRLQVGGSDQWGNIVAGMDLSRRLKGLDTYGVTFPLVTKSDGSKFGKSETGNIWLDPKRTSPYKFYQFWLNQADGDTAQYLKYFTFLSQSEVADLERQIVEEPHRRAAQRKLAEEVTLLVHGAEALENAQKASLAMFGGELTGLDTATLLDIFSEVPSSTHEQASLSGQVLLVDLLVEAGVFTSKGEARRMIKNGGLYLNNAPVSSAEDTLSPQSCIVEGMAVVRKGKKNYHLLRFEG
jgi:tyrosyl-tRNA synthetase